MSLFLVQFFVACLVYMFSGVADCALVEAVLLKRSDMNKVRENLWRSAETMNFLKKYGHLADHRQVETMTTLNENGHLADQGQLPGSDRPELRPREEVETMTVSNNHGHLADQGQLHGSDRPELRGHKAEAQAGVRRPDSPSLRADPSSGGSASSKSVTHRRRADSPTRNENSPPRGIVSTASRSPSPTSGQAGLRETLRRGRESLAAATRRKQPAPDTRDYRRY